MRPIDDKPWAGEGTFPFWQIGHFLFHLLIWCHGSQAGSPSPDESSGCGVHRSLQAGNTGIYREEVFQDDKGTVVRYNLAFIPFGLCQRDNGRVLGYDNAHGYHERHWMGKSAQADYQDYAATVARFIEEVQELKEQA